MKRLLVLLSLVVAALAAVPLVAPGLARAECSVPELPGVGCLAPSPTPSPTESPSAPPPTSEPTFAPPPSEPVPQPTADLTAAPEPLAPVGQPPAVPVGPSLPPAPVLPSPTAVPVVLASTPLTQVVPSAYAIVVFGLIGVALLVSFLSGLLPAGGTMKATRTRLWAGLGVLAAAAVVGGIGWYRISGEPLLNRQIPFLASAGIAVVVLAVLGGALIVAEQLRSDQDRIRELEDAVRALTEALAPTIEREPRR